VQALQRQAGADVMTEDRWYSWQARDPDDPSIKHSLSFFAYDQVPSDNADYLTDCGMELPRMEPAVPFNPHSPFACSKCVAQQLERDDDEEL
jgi:hypothetical protein